MGNLVGIAGHYQKARQHEESGKTCQLPIIANDREAGKAEKWNFIARSAILKKLQEYV